LLAEAEVKDVDGDPADGGDVALDAKRESTLVSRISNKWLIRASREAIAAFWASSRRAEI
jgi:hypothetical protein